MAGTPAEATRREVAATKTETAEGFGIEIKVDCLNSRERMSVKS